MWQSSMSPARLCLLALLGLAACSVDLSKLRALHHGDASPDLVLPFGDTGVGTADSEGRLERASLG